MNNGLLHDTLMLDPIEACLDKLGADPIRREYHLGDYGDASIVDLFAVLDDKVLVIEAETQCTDRVLNDIRKAQAVTTSGLPVRLVIVVPTRKVAQAVIRLLRRASQRGDLNGIDRKQIRPIVLTAGYVPHWIWETFQPSVPLC